MIQHPGTTVSTGSSPFTGVGTSSTDLLKYKRVTVTSFQKHPNTSQGAKMPEENKIEEKKYYDRLNISVISISKAKEIIKSDIKNTLKCFEKNLNVTKQSFRMVGPAGVGKTQICFQMADELSKELNLPFKIIKINAPVLSRDDMLVPYPILNHTEMTGKFRMLFSDFIPNEDTPYGIFLIDEFSRGDKQFQQLLWQIQNENAIHTHIFPKGWFIVSADNPDDSEYQIEEMQDAAGLRRQLHFYIDVDVKDFLKYAIENDFHKHVVDFIQINPQNIYDFEAQKLGSVFSNPASWERLSDHLKKAEANGGIEKNLENLEILASGLVNVNMARHFIAFVNDRGIDINLIISKYDEVRPTIQAMKDENKNDKMTEVIIKVTNHLIINRPKLNDKELSNINDFLSDLPLDISSSILISIDSLEKTTKARLYMTEFLSSLMKKFPSFRKNFYEPIMKVSMK